MHLWRASEGVSCSFWWLHELLQSCSRDHNAPTMHCPTTRRFPRHAWHVQSLPTAVASMPHDLLYKHCRLFGTHVTCTLLIPSACDRQVAPLRVSAQAAGLAASTVFNPVSARFAPAAGWPQAGSMAPGVSPARQPPGPGEASTPSLTPCATLLAPGIRAGQPAQPRQAKVAGYKSHCDFFERLSCISHASPVETVHAN